MRPGWSTWARLESNVWAPERFPFFPSSLSNTFIFLCLSLYSSLTGSPSPPPLYCQSRPQARLASLNCLRCWHDLNLDTLPSPRSQCRLLLLRKPAPNSPLQRPETRPWQSSLALLGFWVSPKLTLASLEAFLRDWTPNPQASGRRVWSAAILLARCS